MTIKRNLFPAIGLLMAILGLSIAVDTALADGCGCCCCCCGGGTCPNKTTPSCGTMPCYTPTGGTGFGSQHICDDASGSEILCTGSNYQFVTVAQFPQNCANDQYGSYCDQVLTDCYQATSCTYKDGKCLGGTASGIWTKASMYVPKSCPT